MATQSPICNRCQNTAHELPEDPDGCKLWKVKFNHATEETILCGPCLDILDNYAKQETGHAVNYEAPEGIHLGEPCPGHHLLGCDNPITHDLSEGVAGFGLCEECFQAKK